MRDRPFNVLFLCTGNSARSIMAEVIMNQLGHGDFKAYSAGTHPRGQLHPMTEQLLQRYEIDTSSLSSKSWQLFADADAPQMDFIFTVCDQAAGEACPAWPGQPITAHWGFADPAKSQGSEEQQLREFSRIYNEIGNRIRIFLSLPLHKLDGMSLQRELNNIGLMRTSSVATQGEQ